MVNKTEIKNKGHSSIFIFDKLSISILTVQNKPKLLSGFEQKVIQLAEEWLSPKNEFEFQTSGSTGTPKQIAFTRAQIKSSVKLTQNFFGLQAGQAALLCLDPNFIAGKMMIVRALEIGVDLICLPPSANPLENLKEDSVIEFAALVPYQLEAILASDAATKKLNRIKKVIVGGAAVPDDLIQRLQSLSSRFYETYGMTETLTHVAVRKLNPVEPAFHPLPGVKIFLNDRLCLNIQANHLSPEIIRTNDLANILPDGSFSLIGRYDNIINTAGVKVSPEEVERKISTVMSNNLSGLHYFIGGVKDKAFWERVVLLVESEPIPDAIKNSITGQMRLILKKWEVPKEIICIPSFKRTSSGKVNRIETKFSKPDLTPGPSPDGEG